MAEVRRLALIPVRDFVLCPGSELPIYVGRDATVRAFKHAKAEPDRNVAVFTQLKVEFDGPITASDLHAFGTIARINTSIETTDGCIKGMLEGVERVRLESLSVVDGISFAYISPTLETKDLRELSVSEQAAMLSLLGTWLADLRTEEERPEMQILQTDRSLSTLLPTLQALVAVPRIDALGSNRRWALGENSPSQAYLDAMNVAVTLRQRALEVDGSERKFEALLSALRFDVSCQENALS